MKITIADNLFLPLDAVERAKSGLSARQCRFFDLIAAAYSGAITREQIAEAVWHMPAEATTDLSHEETRRMAVDQRIMFDGSEQRDAELARLRARVAELEVALSSVPKPLTLLDSDAELIARLSE